MKSGKMAGQTPATAVLDVLPTQDLTGASQDLRECLSGGTAFHNTNLLRAEREAVERGYRSATGGIHALVATTTLAAGINTPASTVVLAENEFVGEDGRQFTVAEYKNMAGRAGRLGFNEIGKAIILAETPMERKPSINDVLPMVGRRSDAKCPRGHMHSDRDDRETRPSKQTGGWPQTGWPAGI